MADELNIITSDANTVAVNTEDRILTITNNSDSTTVTLSAAETTTVQIATIGPKGDKGDTGNIDSSTLATTGSNTFIGNQTITGSLTVSGSSTLTNIGPAIFSGSINTTNGITGSLLGTASFASTASYALNAGAGAGFPYSGSAVITGSLLVTSVITGSFSGSVVGYVPNEATTSFITNQQTGSFVKNDQTASFVTNNQTASFATTESLNNFTSSINNFTQSINNWTGSVITNTQTGSMLQPYALSTQLNSYVTTGSSDNVQTLQGSLIINQNLTVLGSSSITYVTSSQLNIGTNLITVNTSTPAIRFGGLAVYDSGSTNLTGSILWDSQNNVWIYTNPSGSANYDGAMFLTGPKNTGTTGNEVGITENYLAKGAGSHHMTASQISDDGTNVSIAKNLIVTGSITGSFSGSVVGYVPNTATSSFTTNNQTGSFITNSQTASFARTGSNSFNGNQTINGSTLISGSLTVTGSTNLFVTTGTTLLSSNADTLTITGSLIVTGSSIMTGSLNVTGGITGSFSGSVVGYVPNTATSSFITNSQTSSFVTNSQTASFATTGSNVLIGTQTITGSLNISGSTHRITGSLSATSFTGSLQGTSSWATNAVSSSYPIAVTGTTIYTNTITNPSTISSVLLGFGAGTGTNTLSDIIAIGASAGTSAGSTGAISIGTIAGRGQSNPSYSINIGYKAGFGGENTIGYSNNITIGTNIALPDGRRDSINIGGIIFGTGSYSTITSTSTAAYTGTSNGRIGINVVNPQYTLDVSGDANFTGGITSGGTISAAGQQISAGAVTVNGYNVYGPKTEGALDIPNLNGYTIDSPGCYRISVADNTDTYFLGLPSPGDFIGQEICIINSDPGQFQKFSDGGAIPKTVDGQQIPNIPANKILILKSVNNEWYGGYLSNS